MNDRVKRYKEPANWLQLWSFPQLIDQCVVQGGRSFTEARVAPAEKFGLGRKS